MNQYVIIGNGIAAAGCIEGIRTRDKSGSITVVSKENHPVYCRPLISYYLEGKTDLERINYRGEDFYKTNKCDVLYDKTANMLDPSHNTVSLSDGVTLHYTSLCVAAGSSPFIPRFKGIENVKNKFSFITLNDALQIEKSITNKSKVLIIGAGLIGLKCAEGLHDRVEKITVCDLSDMILSSILDKDTSPIIENHLKEIGIELLLSDSVDYFENSKAIMKSKKAVDFDVLITAVGVRPNTSLVLDANGEVDRGILVDEHMKTSLDNVYSAGDCTEGYDASSDRRRVLALLPNAYMQGFTAGVNMAGGCQVFDRAIPMNSIGLFGYHIMTAGSYISDNSSDITNIQLQHASAKKFFVKDGLLKGYIFINETDKAGIFTSLIREKTPLDSIDFELLKKMPTFAAFSEKIRRKQFGSVV